MAITSGGVSERSSLMTKTIFRCKGGGCIEKLLLSKNTWVNPQGATHACCLINIHAETWTGSILKPFLPQGMRGGGEVTSESAYTLGSSEGRSRGHMRRHTRLEEAGNVSVRVSTTKDSSCGSRSCCQSKIQSCRGTGETEDAGDSPIQAHAISGIFRLLKCT